MLVHVAHKDAPDVYIDVTPSDAADLFATLSAAPMFGPGGSLQDVTAERPILVVRGHVMKAGARFLWSPGPGTTWPELTNVKILIPSSYHDSPKKLRFRGTKAELCEILKSVGGLDLSPLRGPDVLKLDYEPFNKVDFVSNQEYLGYVLCNHDELDAFIKDMAQEMERQAAKKVLRAMGVFDPGAYGMSRRDFQSATSSLADPEQPLVKFRLNGFVVAEDVLVLVEVKSMLTTDAIEQIKCTLTQIHSLLSLSAADAGPDAELFRGKKLCVALAVRYAPSDKVKAELQRAVKEDKWAVWLPDGPGLGFGDSCLPVPNTAALRGGSFASISKCSRGAQPAAWWGSTGSSSIATNASSGGSHASYSTYSNSSASNSMSRPKVSAAWAAALARQGRPVAAPQRLPHVVSGFLCAALAALRKKV